MAVLSILSQYSVTKPTGMWEALLGLFDFIGNYGWRVILFTVLLKLVLSPLDFFQKYKMKKNQRVTEMLKPEMDKLQRQYANDKTTLQQQQMKVQKAAGVSHFYACIPLIVTMLVFFTFWAGVRNIGKYEEFKQYVELYDKYSSHYTQLTGLDMTGESEWDENYDDKDFMIMLNNWQNSDLEQLTDAEKAAIAQSSSYMGQSENWYKDMYSDWLNMKNFVKFFNANPVSPANHLDYTEGAFFKGDKSFDIDAVFEYTGTKTAEANSAKAEIMAALNSKFAGGDWNLKYQGSRLTSFANFEQVYLTYQYLDTESDMGEAIAVFLAIADVDAAEVTYNYYTENRQSFLWIKSIWVADVPWSDAIPKFTTFRSSVEKYFKGSNPGGLEPEVLDTLNNENTYNKVMLKIREDKSVSGVNGFLILAVFSVGLAFLSQFITTRQQKKSGQMMGAGMGGNMKMMMMIMPIISGVFALMYTAAFAVYMVTNSLMSLLINLISTFIINLVFNKKHKADYSDTGVVKYGRRDPNDMQGKGGKK